MITVQVELLLDGAEGLDTVMLHNALEDHVAGGTFYVREGVFGGVPVVIDEVGRIETLEAS